MTELARLEMALATARQMPHRYVLTYVTPTRATLSGPMLEHEGFQAVVAVAAQSNRLVRSVRVTDPNGRVLVNSRRRGTATAEAVIEELATLDLMSLLRGCADRARERGPAKDGPDAPPAA